ncbi:PEP/pyruvate-binding domain-containing protein [Nocardiopsis sp. NRRL B-16309]|uniref:PEP/pyruvate-binding domain-containing protein n=1 Tax=Nocardiopsis sp. NRRL B-16309 TaxID=1519494 RepID=UPI0006AFDD46|nr:PEP/pyruvate-binding domain-containing protein [Nocardiopsis sp. NRRL B-16309]KOX17011.1 phosphoenolpyruvate synthase [Nocardiopsis sp. NRRL B-16309]
MTHERLVSPLASFGSADLAEVGGKAANLGELLRAGLPVPPGFVVTTGAYAAAARAVGLDAKLAAGFGGASAPATPSSAVPSPAVTSPTSVAPGTGDNGAGDDGGPVSEAVALTAAPDATTADPAGSDAPGPSDAAPLPDAAELRADLEGAPVPDDLRDAITAAYAALGTDVPVAVRSSATAEDLPGAAFAGQQDTYLNVIGADQVVDAVRRCWASLWTDRAVAYRRERAIDPAEVRIAVVVQAMVQSDVAGVMFTADPVTGDRDRVVVDAGAGLGEAVVSGLVTPDHYVLDERGTLLDWSPGRGEVVVRSEAGGGVVHGSGPSGEARERLLTDEQLAVLAGHARAIAEHFGRPQDIEWSISDGRTHIVQARPMTALPPPSVPLNRRQRLLGAVLTEYLPTRPYPMDVSTWLGFGPAKMMRDLMADLGVAAAFENYLREEDGVVVELVPPAPHPTPRALLTPVKLIHRARSYDVNTWREDPVLTRFLRDADELDALDLPALTWPELLRVPQRTLDLMGPSRELRAAYLPGTAIALGRLVAATALLGRRSLLGDLLGGARTRTEDANQALQDLADRVRSVPELRELFATADPAGVLAAVREGAGPVAAFGDQLDAFRREFGRRETATPLLVSPPTLAESPESVIGLVSVLVDQPRGEDRGSRSERALARLLTHPLLRSARARRRMTRWVRAAQQGMAFREDSHFYFTASLPALRRSLLEIGARLAKAGVVEEPFDVFHLRMEEVLEVADVEAMPAEQAERLRSLVRARSAKRAELTGVRMVDPARVFPPKNTGNALVTGTPASAGTATGTARIILDSTDFHRLDSGDVLVCPYTNPSWTPLFQRAAAVVVDTGAVASHAAIVAREYGIPAVMGTGTGTTTISDGDRITVDGGTGRVTPAS